jgi:outer membrane lipoprotein-sorting protein
MRRFLLPLVAVFALSSTVRADDAADARAIVEKAIKARGDKPDGKATAMTWKEKGKFTAMGLELPYTAEWAFQAPDKYRFAMTGDFGGATVSMTVVVNGEKAWANEGKKAEELTGEKLVQTRNEAYQFWVMSLTPLLSDKGFTLATAKGKDVNGKPTSAVKVTRDKKPAMTLYFDKDTGLLVKREVVVKDEFQNWKEVLDEATFTDYKDANGVKTFTKLKIVRDGKPLIESTLSDAKFSEKLDEKLFEKP